MCQHGAAVSVLKTPGSRSSGFVMQQGAGRRELHHPRVLPQEMPGSGCFHRKYGDWG